MQENVMLGIVPLYFDKYYKIAVSIYTCATAFGITLMPLLTQWLLSIYGWHGALLLIAGVGLHTMPFSVLLHSKTNKDWQETELQHSTDDKSCNNMGYVNTETVEISRKDIVHTNNTTDQPHNEYRNIGVNENAKNQPYINAVNQNTGIRDDAIIDQLSIQSNSRNYGSTKCKKDEMSDHCHDGTKHRNMKIEEDAVKTDKLTKSVNKTKEDKQDAK